MNIKKNIPNIITCGNLFCGCLAIVYGLKGDLVFTAYLVGIGAILDFLDGLIARILNVHSEIGKQLDSLADMVTFGVVPGIVLFVLLSNSIEETAPYWLVYSGFLVTIFSAVRLARFNTDTRQTNFFIGLPTPAATILICSLPLIINFQPQMAGHNLVAIIKSPIFLISISVIVSILLIAELPLFALKFKNFGWSDNVLRYTFLIISCILLILFKFIAIPFIIFLYISLSVANNMKTQIED